MKLSVTLCGVVGDVRTVYCPDSYLGPANVEMLLLSDDHVIIKSFSSGFFLGSSVPLQCIVFSCACLRSKTNFGFEPVNFKK